MIHPALVLPITPELTAAVLPDARYVFEQYQTRRKSQYETSLDRILRGLLAEEALARHRGAKRADVRRPYAEPYDVSPDIEVRAVKYPWKVDGWADVCLTLYAKDRAWIRRRWVLAVVSDDDIRYQGWETGEVLVANPTTATSQGGKRYQIAGTLYPDQLRPMETLT